MITIVCLIPYLEFVRVRKASWLVLLFFLLALWSPAFRFALIYHWPPLSSGHHLPIAGPYTCLLKPACLNVAEVVWEVRQAGKEAATGLGMRILHEYTAQVQHCNMLVFVELN